MKMNLRWTFAIALPLLASPGSGQEGEVPKAPRVLETPKAPPTALVPEAPRRQVPLRIQLVLSKYQGEKKLSSLPYQILANADDTRGTMLRMGIEVPVQMTGGANTSFAYRIVGTSIDCNVVSDRDSPGRFRMQLGVEQSSLYSVAGEKSAGPAVKGELVTSDAPLFRTFKVNFPVVLRDGESAQSISVPDPVNGEVLKVDVTLNMLK